MSFRRGQPVVCVDDSATNDIGVIEIVSGRIYTVRAVVDPDELAAAAFGRPLDEPGLLLVEVTRPLLPEIGEIPFGALRFRPIDGGVLVAPAGREVPA